jgi:uncharacterized protein
MDRYLKKLISAELNKKIVLITGPRQVGKTTLSKALVENCEYLNYDNIFDRKKIHKSEVNFNTTHYIFDEIHKMKNWKRWLKGHFDTRKKNNIILVTGSAKIETYKKMGDSLAGRFYQYKLFPLDVKEAVNALKIKPELALNNLLELSGFPEPFLSDSKSEYRKWQKTHLDIILRQDLIENESVQQIKSIELLIELLRERVASPISYNSLREDIGTDDKSIKRWCNTLEDNYVLFKIQPYFTRVQTAIKKSPKYYFFDVPRVANEGARFENQVALSLFKEINLRNDADGENYSLHYMRNKNQKEVDFIICNNKKPVAMLECKLSDNSLDNSFSIFEKFTGEIPKYLIIKNLKKETTLKNGAKVVLASDWLAQMKW